MGLVEIYKKIQNRKINNLPIRIIDKNLFNRFEYFINIPNFYEEYDYDEVFYLKLKIKNNNQKKILLINLDYRDYIQSWFFRNEIVKYCNKNTFNLDSISIYPYKTLKCELDCLFEFEKIKYGQEWLFPTDNNKWKNVFKYLLLKKNKYDLIICNGINYYFYYLLSIEKKCQNIFVYDPHLLVGINDFRDLSLDFKEINKKTINNLKIIADAEEKKYKDHLSFLKFKEFISFKHALSSFLKKKDSLKNKNYKTIFMGGDTNRDYYSMLRYIEKYPEINFIICTSKKLAISAKNLKVYSRLRYHKFISLIDSADFCLIPLKERNISSGLIVTTISFLLGKICISVNNERNRKYIKNNFNGFLFESDFQLDALLSQIAKNQINFREIKKNIKKVFNNEHRLESLVKKIFTN